MARDAWGAIKRRAPSGPSVVTAILPALALGILIQVGPWLQYFLFSLISSERASIYEAAFGKT